jgi:DNA-binding CsgD family transcriptional regulator
MTGFASKKQMSTDKLKGNIMTELEYEIQEMFIEGMEAKDIAVKLKLSLGKVVSVLNSFGVTA